MRQTGRTEVDLAVLAYDEKLMACTRPAGVRHLWTPRHDRRQRDRMSRKGERFLMVRKAIDVRV